MMKLSGGTILVPADEWQFAEITTQIAADSNNYPDIEIKGSDFICWIEVKDGGDPESGQLERYQRLLESRPESSKGLVSLTRSRLLPLQLPLLCPAVGWSQIAVWLNEIRPRSSDGLDPVADYLIVEFLEFLGGIGMSVDKVGFELVSGVEQLRNMQSLVRESLELECGITPFSGGSKDTLNHYVPDKGGTMAFAAAIYFDNPASLGFEANRDYVSDPSTLDEGWDEISKNWFRKELDLSAEEIYFFSRSVSSQVTIVRNFLRECLDQVGHEFGERAVRTSP